MSTPTNGNTIAVATATAISTGSAMRRRASLNTKNADASHSTTTMKPTSFRIASNVAESKKSRTGWNGLSSSVVVTGARPAPVSTPVVSPARRGSQFIRSGTSIPHSRILPTRYPTAYDSKTTIRMIARANATTPSPPAFRAMLARLRRRDQQRRQFLEQRQRARDEDGPRRTGHLARPGERRGRRCHDLGGSAADRDPRRQIGGVQRPRRRRLGRHGGLQRR